ncbi:MAG: hypothetical protein CMA58_03435, partial [Euryarchaeota archaeon]|nr:hypothetical protein [Euryarchaeota archaeon]
MCGIIGIVGHPDSHSASMIYDGMLVLQHRGQDAAQSRVGQRRLSFPLTSPSRSKLTEVKPRDWKN